MVLVIFLGGCITVYDYATTNMENPVFNTSVTVTGQLDIAHIFGLEAKQTPTPTLKK